MVSLPRHHSHRAGLRGGRAYLPHQPQNGFPAYWYQINCAGAGKLKIIRYIGDLGCGGGLYPPSYRSQYIPYGSRRWRPCKRPSS